MRFGENYSFFWNIGTNRFFWNFGTLLEHFWNIIKLSLSVIYINLFQSSKNIIKIETFNKLPFFVLNRVLNVFQSVPKSSVFTTFEKT
jgi:hypothetical protein